MLKRGAQLNSYRIVRFLGEGGMGEVYEALHVELNKRVALKTLRPKADDGPTVKERFLREGRAAARLRHPHVVDVFDAGQADGIVFLVMELLEGEDLADLLKRETRLAPDGAVDLLLPVLSAVGTVHGQGIIHRDLKPQNIFLARGTYGETLPKVLDFGISKVTAVDGALTTAGEELGSPFYMSPEQAHGETDLDGRSDQFALAVIAYELLSGERPFQGPNLPALLFAIQMGEPTQLLDLAPEVPEDLSEAVMRALSREPEDRFASVLEFGRALLPFAGDRARLLWEPAFAAPPPPPTRGSTADRPRRPSSPLEDTQPPPEAGAVRPAPAPRQTGARPATGTHRALSHTPRPAPARPLTPRPLTPRPAQSTPRPLPSRPVTGAHRAPASTPRPGASPGREPLPARRAPGPAGGATPPMGVPRATPRPPRRAEPPPDPLLVLPIADARAAELARERILGSDRLVLLCEAKGAAPEKRAPLVHVLPATRGLIEVVVLVDEGGGWRDPMGELCKEFAPDRYDAKNSYLFFDRGRLIFSLRKDLWNTVADAERITDFLAAKIDGVQRYLRPKDD